MFKGIVDLVSGKVFETHLQYKDVARFVHFLLYCHTLGVSVGIEGKQRIAASIG